jgi:N-acetylmuramoyl-L-alanine amidase
MAILTNDTIILDDGHGMNTAGKRTPIFPSPIKSETGNFMHENEFNRAVVKYLGEHLVRNGFKVINIAPTDEDTSLTTRVRNANNANGGLYISVHANAMTGEWGNAKGIETYAFTDDATSKLIGGVIHKHLKKGTPQVDRGLKDGDWLYVVKNTKMPAVLVECGFMDNLEEAKLLLSDAFRRENAQEIAMGICELYGRTFKDEAKPASTPTPKPTPKPVAKPTPQPVVKPAPQPVEKPVVKPKSVFQAELALAVTWAKENKISDGSRLNDNCTRGEMIVMLKRLEDKIGGKK